MTKIIDKKIKATNRHWKNFLDKNYLGSHNLEIGEEMLLTIEKFVGEEEIKDTKGSAKVKPVLYFKENVPKMILNITNGNMLSSLYGSHPDKWIGKKVQIYSTKTAFGRDTVDALRIRDFIPKGGLDTSEAEKALSGCKTLAELQSVWKSLTVSAREEDVLIALKDQLKTKLS